MEYSELRVLIELRAFVAENFVVRCHLGDGLWDDIRNECIDYVNPCALFSFPHQSDRLALSLF